MKRISTLLSLSFFVLTSLPFLQAQQLRTVNKPSFGSYIGSEKWIAFDQSKNITVTNVWDDYGREIGLSSWDEMVFVKTDIDAQGWSHHRFQQLHRGVPVEHAVYRVHEQDGKVIKGNGELALDVDINTDPAVTEQEALEIALKEINAVEYAWEDPQMESMKKFATDDPSATFYPAGQLLIVDEDHIPETPAAYYLTWKFEIHTAEPEGRKWIYVNAQDGSIVKEVNMDMHEHGYPATAVTRYSGVRQMITDSTDQGFVLRDYTRARGVHTFDAQDSFDLDYSTDFFDDDNHWDNKNLRANDAGTDAHWGAEMYYDYLKDHHGLISYDNLGSKLICYVHVGQNWYNASWNGFWTRYGNAGGDPWTHIDVVGHEFTHGLTYAFPGLIYEMESGALNESFSDILGEALQNYTNGVVDWLATPSPVDTIRSYSNPNDYDNPDTYHGDHWEFGEFDNYGVHINSGVQNHWFYLLVNGGVGMNDNGQEYSVEALGFDRAMDIVIRNMTVYLFPTSKYVDARQGSLQSAEDIFGPCSFEYRQVANAWHAVGVGERVDDNDFTVLGVEQMELCNVPTMSPVKVRLKHLGCQQTGPLSLTIRLNKSNPISFFEEVVELPNGAAPGEEFEHIFNKEFDFNRKGVHILSAKVTTAGDLYTTNDQSKEVTVHQLSPIEEQGFPFHGRIALRTFKDSIAFITGEHADLDIWFNAGRDSTYGIRIQGDRASYARPVYKFKDPFDFNHRLGAQLCSCVDATTNTTFGLQFDLRQTYSNNFEDIVGVGQPKTSVMRVMADGDEIARYFPETNSDDPWQTHNLDLSNYVGREFTLCFETRTILSLEDDNYDIGDRVFLDNIYFLKDQLTSVHSVSNVQSLRLYPNPADGEVEIEIPSESFGNAEVSLLGLTGNVIQQREVAVSPGTNKIELSVDQIAAGAYFIEVRTVEEKRVGKLVIQ